MIKKIIASLLATFAMASAMASGGFNIFAAVGFETLEPKMKAEGLIDGDGRFSTEVLAKPTAMYIKTVYPQIGLDVDVIAKKWLEAKALPKTMTGVEYDKVRKNLGYDDAFVASLRGDATTVKTAAKVADAPKLAVVAQAAPTAPEAATAPVLRPDVKSAPLGPVRPSDESIGPALADLTKKVAEMDARGDANAKALKAELAAIATQSGNMAATKQYEEVAGKLNNISAAVSKAEAAAGRAEAAAKVASDSAAGAKASAEEAAKSADAAGEMAEVVGKSAINAKDSAVEAAKSADTATKAVDAVQAGLKTVNGMVQNTYLTWGGLLVGLIALAVAIWRKRGGSLDMKEVKKVVSVEVKEAVAVETQGLNDRVASAEAKAKKALNKVNRLAEGIQVVEFDDAFKSGIFDLQLDAKVFFWKAVLMGKADGVMLAFELVDPDYVLVYGIEGQTKPVRLSEGALKGVIGRATKLDEEGKCRLVGLSQDEVDALEKRLLPEKNSAYADTVSGQPDTMPVDLDDDDPVAKLEAWSKNGGLSKEAVAQYVQDQNAAQAKAGKPAHAYKPVDETTPRSIVATAQPTTATA